MCRRTEEEIGPTVGLPCHRHFVGFFNVPVHAPTRGHPFYGCSEKPPNFNRLSRRAWGYEGPILVIHPRVPTGAWHVCDCNYVTKHYNRAITFEQYQIKSFDIWNVYSTIGTLSNDSDSVSDLVTLIMANFIRNIHTWSFNLHKNG